MSNQELLHAVVALYDSCLPEITPEVLYPTVCGKWAKTLVLLRDFQGRFPKFLSISITPSGDCLPVSVDLLLFSHKYKEKLK